MTEQLSGWTLVARLSFSSHARDGVTAESIERISYLLNERGIQHQMEREGETVALWVEDKEQAAPTIELLDQFQSDTQPPVFDLPSISRSLTTFWYEMPVVALMILGSVLGALLVRFQFNWVHHFTFQDFIQIGGQIGFYPAEQSFKDGEYWRLFTPAFLHFGLFHLLFNSLWMWELGRRIEKLAGSAHMLMLVTVTALIANIAQFGWGGPSLFGGMSGVVYGLVGYVWIRHQYAPHPLLAVQRGVIIFMLVWLVICMTGVIGLFMPGDIANAAHVGGLLTGMGLGWWAARR